jgi:hypothetical protein
MGMAGEPYEVGGGGAGYSSYYGREQRRPASEVAATTFASSRTGTDGYVVGGEAPLEAAPVAEGHVDPREAKRRRVLLVALAVSAAVAAIVLVVGLVVFKTEAPSDNPTQEVPQPALDEDGNVNPAEGL